ncbi:MAG: hypothetical protein HONBIEJF_00729 [Fimbriimonadaceae bacterium]|nr:hypothetical protein [Fimbriimonadaceae bacterium]
MQSGCLIACALSAFAGHQPIDSEWSGPFSHRSERAINLMFLRMPLVGKVKRPGSRSWSFGISQSNDFRQDGSIDEDYEQTRLTIEHRIGMTCGEIWFGGSFVARGSGFLDPLIDFWHRNLFAGTDTSRDRAAKYRSVVAQAGRYSVGSSAGMGDLAIGFRRALGRFTGDVAVEVPTGNRGGFFGNGSFDLGVSIQRGWDLGRGWRIFGLLAAVYQGHHPSLLRSNRWVGQQSVALQFQPNSRDAWTLGWQSEDAPSETGTRFSDLPHRNLHLSFCRRLNERSTLELYISEDGDLFRQKLPQVASRGPDFAAGLQFVIRY